MRVKGQLTWNQNVAMTRLWKCHPEGCVVRLQTAKALVRRGLARQPSPKRPAWLKLSPEGLQWCEGMGW